MGGNLKYPCTENRRHVAFVQDKRRWATRLGILAEKPEGVKLHLFKLSSREDIKISEEPVGYQVCSWKRMRSNVSEAQVLGDIFLCEIKRREECKRTGYCVIYYLGYNFLKCLSNIVGLFVTLEK